MLGRSIKLYFLLIFLPVLAFAQTGNNEDRNQPADVSGLRSGSFDLILPDGTVQHETAWVDLQQKNNVISGTAGASVEKQTAISDGQVNGHSIQFRMNIRAGTILTFHLILSGNHLKGEVSGDPQGAKIKIDVGRIRESELTARGANRDLRREILQADQMMFDAFNNRSLEKFKTFFSEDLEFYQDLTGLSDYRKNIATFQTNFAKAAAVRRELDLTKLEIYPIKDYGAMEIGTHRFYTTEPGQPEKLTAEVKFVHIWHYRNGVWKITRVISYGH